MIEKTSPDDPVEAIQFARPELWPPQIRDQRDRYRASQLEAEAAEHNMKATIHETKACEERCEAHRLLAEAKTIRQNLEGRELERRLQD